MSAPVIMPVARGDDDPAVRTSSDVVIDHLHRLCLDLRVGLGLLNSTTPTVHEAVKVLTDIGVEEVAMVPMDLVSATDHSLVLTYACDKVSTVNPGLSIVIVRPTGPDVNLLNALDIKLREAPHRVNAVEVDTLVSTHPDGGDLRGSSLLARRARQWSAHCKLPVQLAQNDVIGCTTALAVNALHGQGWHHIAADSLFLTPGPVFRAHQQAAIRAGALAVTSPITENPRVTELILTRYAFAVMWLLDIDPREDGI